MTPDLANFNPSCPGRWINGEIGYGYELSNRRELHGWFGRIKIVYDYTPIYDHPKFFEQRDGVRIACPAISGTDQGSVPPFVQSWLPKDGLLGYYTHDAAARDGGLYFRYPGEKEWTFRRVTRWQSDRLLRTTAQHDPVAPVGPARAWAVEFAVRLAHYPYHDWTRCDYVPTWPGQEKPDVDDPLPMGAN
jgi:hypothetical protein